MKLTAHQIGRLAIHVERAIAENPIITTPEETKCPWEEWEKALQKFVDEDPELPSYEDDSVLYWTEYFTDYFTREDH